MSKAANHVFTAGAAAAANYIEDVFSTYLYTGSGTNQSINNGIQLGSQDYGSMQFTTTGSRLLSSNTLTIGSGDFTFECWVNFSSSAAAVDASIFSSTGTSTGRVAIRISNGVLQIGQFGLTWDNSATSQTWNIGTWYHIAIVRSSGTLTFYRNGVSIGSGSNAINYVTTSGTEIGSLEPSYSGYDFPGYISQLRISTTAIYTSTFTPPTSPLTVLPSTILLTCQGSDVNSGSTTMVFTTTNVTMSTESPFTTVAGKGGLVWIKSRSSSTYPNHWLWDTVRTVSGHPAYLSSNIIDGQGDGSTDNIYFKSTGFNYLSSPAGNEVNKTYTSWTFRKQRKFFDIVTYSGTGTTNSVPHNLGTTPGCIIVKRTSGSEDWLFWHNSIPSELLRLNTSNNTSANNRFGTISPSAFTLSSADADSNAVGSTYVAYLFADDAGGFGLTGSDNVISCGSYTGTGATGNSITLGYEPQWLLIKRTDAVDDWVIFDNMRGMPVGGADAYLKPNLTSVESTLDYVDPTATGFTLKSSGYNIGSGNYIYIAIRRGPMKVPTDATKVFSVTKNTNRVVTTNFPVDVTVHQYSSSLAAYHGGMFDSRLTGSRTSCASNAQEATTNFTFASNVGTTNTYWNNGDPVVYMSLRRAPGFFDEVAYTGNGLASRTVTHNLGVVPEMMIVKTRDGETVTGDWIVYHKDLTEESATKKYWLILNSNAAQATSIYGGIFSGTANQSATDFKFTNAEGFLGYYYYNYTGKKYVSRLFATCAGVSKVGSYTGTGTTKQIDCGFVAGARFVLIKRTDSTGDWYFWDSARGIISGNDPYLLLNSDSVVENISTDYLDPYSAGFELSSTAPAAINANGGTYIFLAIA